VAVFEDIDLIDDQYRPRAVLIVSGMRSLR
jgi:hypothetical protein